MKHILLIYGFIAASFVMACDFDTDKTKELKDYLTELVIRFEDTEKRPDPIELSKKIKSLVEQRADPQIQNSTNNGTCSLHFAAEIGDFDLCQFLINHQADIEAQDNDGSRALDWAHSSGHDKLVNRLLEMGANL